MKFSTVGLFVAGVLGCVSLSAQTGPGGVGNSSNNIQWVDAAQLTGFSNGAPVSTFTDNSGNGYDFVQGSSTRRPVYLSSSSTANNKPAIVFDGVNDFMGVGTIPEYSTNQIKWFVIGNAYSTSPTRMFVSTRSTASNILWSTMAAANFETQTRGASNSYKSVNLGPQTGTNVLHSDWRGNLGLFSGYVNGALMGSVTGANASPSHVLTRLGSSSYGTGGNYLTGEINEFFTYTGSLNTAQTNIIYNYLGAKYGITVPNYVYAWDSTHEHEVAGIGRDNASNLHTDAQGSSIVRINSPSNLNDGEYMLWGNDAGGLTQNFSDLPSTFSGSRFNQVWRVSETGGDVGTVTMIWDLSQNQIGDPSAYALLIDSDGNFSSGATTVSGTYNSSNNTLTFTGLNLAHGDYFTLGNQSEIISIATGNWDSASTWNCGCVPGSSSDVTIDTGHVVTIMDTTIIGSIDILNNAMLTFGDTTASLTIRGDLTIHTGGQLDVSATNNPVFILGQWVSNGTFNPRLGTVTFTGTTAQTMSGPGPTPFFNLVIDNTSGVSISSGAFTVSNALTLNPSTTFNTNNNSFTLISDQTNTARIAPIPSGSAVLGDVIVQRYVSAGNADYRELTPPVHGAILSMWDSPSVFMSGPGFPDGCANTNGTCFASVKGWDATTQEYIDMVDYNAPINNMDGYAMFMGDNLYTFSGVTIRDVAGTINLPGTLTRFVPGPGGSWHFVGNPYASAIDFDLTDKNGIYDRFYIWDQSTGGYEFYSNGSASGGNVSPLGLIASGQGFWIEKFQYNSTNYIAFEQADKVTFTTPFVRKQNPFINRQIAFELYSDITPLSGNTTILFDQSSSTNFDDLDITQLESPLDTYVALTAYSEDGKILRRNSLPDNGTDVSVDLALNVTTLGTYYLKPENLDNFGSYSCVILEDLESGKKYDVFANSEIPVEVSKLGSETPRVRVHFTNGDCPTETIANVESLEQSGAIRIRGEFVEFALPEAISAKVTVFNLIGQEVHSQSFGNIQTGTVHLDVQHLNGMHLVVVETPNRLNSGKVYFNNSGK